MASLFAKRKWFSSSEEPVWSTEEEAVRHCCGDLVKVRLASGRVVLGMIKFAGVHFSLPSLIRVVHYGVECTEAVDGGHSGQPLADGRRYFEAAEGCGVFVLRENIVERLKKSTSDSRRVCVCDVVRVKRRGHGVVLFIGPIQGLRDYWYGVDLLDKSGKHDGIVKGIRYFDCKHEFHGVHVRQSQLQEIMQPPPKLQPKDRSSKKTKSKATRVHESVAKNCTQLVFKLKVLKLKIGDSGSALMSKCTSAGTTASTATSSSVYSSATGGSYMSSTDGSLMSAADGSYMSSDGSYMFEAIDVEMGDESPTLPPVLKGLHYGTSVERMARMKLSGDSRKQLTRLPYGYAPSGGRMASSLRLRAPLTPETATGRKRRFHDFYDCDYIEDELGAGAFAAVYKCYSKSKKLGSHRRMYAVKRMQKSLLLSLDAEGRDETFKRIRDEIRHLKHLRREKSKLLPGFKHVMHFVDAFEDDVAIYVVSNFCNGGTLWDYCKAEGGLSEAQSREVIRQVLLGLKFLDYYKIAHLDLNPNNIMLLHPSLAEDRVECALVFQIIDFGLARVIPRLHKCGSGAKVCGTPHFTAPEVLDGIYDPLADLWSLGVVLYMLVFNRVPFASVTLGHLQEDNEAVFARIRNGFQAVERPGAGPWFPSEKSAVCSKAVKDLIGGLLQTDRSKRLDIDRALDHEWFSLTLATATAKATLPHTVQSALVSFSKQCQFRVLMSRMFVHQMSGAEKKRVAEVFALLDADGDNVVDEQQFVEGMLRFELGYDESALRHIFVSLDLNGDGSLRLSDLMTAFAYQSISASDAKLDQVFDDLDADAHGYISRDDLQKKLAAIRTKKAIELKSKRMMQAISPSTDFMLETEYSLLPDTGAKEVIRRAITYADFDGDGHISKPEFLAAMHPELHEGAAVPRPLLCATPTQTATFTFMQLATKTLGAVAPTDGFEPMDLGSSSDEDY